MLTVTSLKESVLKGIEYPLHWINSQGDLVSHGSQNVSHKVDYDPSSNYEISHFAYVYYYSSNEIIHQSTFSAGSLIASIGAADSIRISTNTVNVANIKLIKQEQVYPLLATKIHTSELNGQDDLELKIPQQKNNNLDLLSIDKLWEFDYNNNIYKAVNVKRQTRGHSFNLNVRAMPLFYWEFSKSIIHENHDGSHTANSAFRTVFEGSGFNFVLVDFSPSVEIEGFGKGANRLELFKRLLDRYNYEFIIQGRTVYMHHRIGNDTNFMYKYKLNASNVSSTTDASEYFTHIKGFGDFEEGEEDYFNNAKLKREYTHPLADVVGKWEGSPIVDGRITQTSTLDEAMAQAVEESLAVTIEGTLHDVRKIYDIAVPVKGDRVWLHDERINLEQEIRLHKIVTTYDEKDNIIACDVTFGSQSIGERHKANINSLSKNFRDLLTGKLKLPIISLEQIGMDMINAIHAASSEISFGDFGMMAISKTNPNHVFGLNSEGWYISQDGGATPKTIGTAQGIYADALFAGTLWLTNEMNIESADGYLNMTGSTIKIASKTDPDKYTEISPSGAHFRNGHARISTSSGRDVINDGYILRNPAVSKTYPHSFGNTVDYGPTETFKNYIVTQVDTWETCDFFSFTHEARWLRVYVTLNPFAAAAARARIRMGSNYSDEHRTTQGDDLEYGERLLINLGEPLDYGVRRYAYIEFRKEGTGDNRAGIRINTREQTDYP